MKRNSVIPSGSSYELAPFEEYNQQPTKIQTEASPTIDRSNLNDSSEFGDQTSNVGQHGKISQKQTINNSITISPKNTGVNIKKKSNILQKLGYNGQDNENKTKLKMKDIL